MADEKPLKVVRSEPTLGAQERQPDVLNMQFTGDAWKLIKRLQGRLSDVKEPEDVVLKGLALLSAAEGKEIHLIDINGDSEVVRLWRP